MQHPNELDQQISNLRTLQQSYDQVATAAEAYNTGKVELAANITHKGVDASPTETLPELAEKVLDIQQQTTVLQGGEIYAAQQFGDANPAQSPLWNLYDVLAQMKSQFMGAGQYAALIVCEYYKGYDSLQLQGADAYYTCDGDFYDTSMPLHVWHDSDNERANRWVCFLYAAEGARLDITNTAISPRSMYIGGHIGTIEYFVNGRLTDFICGVEDTDVVDNLILGSYTQNWGRVLVIRNVGKVDLIININNTNSLVLGVEELSYNSLFIIDGITLNSLFMPSLTTLSGSANYGYILLRDAITVSMPLLKNVYLSRFSPIRMLSNTYSPRYVYLSSLTQLTAKPIENSTLSDLILLQVGAMITNLNMSNWNPTNVLADAYKKAQLIDNIKNHILARVSDATGGTQLVFTVSTNMYNEISGETITWNDQTMTLADAFLTKNWLLAGA